MPGKLTDQQKLFISEYLECWNATNAYMASHPKCNSRTTASTNGSRTLGNAKIRAEIDARLDKLAMGSAEVLARLARHARGSHAPWLVIDDDGYAHINFSDPEAQKHLDLIKKIKTKRTRRVVVENKKPEEWEDEWVEVELYDAQAALALIGKHHKLFGDQVDVTSGGEKVAAITVIEVEKL